MKVALRPLQAELPKEYRENENDRNAKGFRHSLHKRRLQSVVKVFKLEKLLARIMSDFAKAAVAA
jgi:hypothetical protein